MALTKAEKKELDKLVKEEAAAQELGGIVSLPPISGVTPPGVGPTLTAPIPPPRERGGLLRAAPEALGATAGFLLGKTPATARAGGVLGAAGGEALGQLGQRLLGGGGPETSTEAAARVGLAGGTEFLGGKLFEAAGRGVRRLIPETEFAEAVTPEAKEAIEILRPRGGILTPAQATENRATDVLQNVAEGSLFGGGAITTVKKRGKDIINDVITNFVISSRGQLSKEELGGLVTSAIEKSASNFRAASRGLFKAVDEATEGAGVDFTGVKILANELETQLKKGIPGGGARRILQTVKNRGDIIPWEEAQILRSDLLAVSRQVGELIPGRGQVISKQLAKELDTAMETGAASLPGDALTKWRAANLFHKEGIPEFNNRLIRKLGVEAPEAVIDTIIKQKNASVIRQLRKTINDKEVWGGIQGEFIENIFTKSTNVEGVISGKAILNQIRRFGKDNIRELFPGASSETIGNLSRFARASIAIEKGQPTGVGGVAIQLIQPGAAIGLVAPGGARQKIGAASILLGPLAISKLFSNSKIVNFMLSGSKKAKTAEQATIFLSRLTAQLIKEDIIAQFIEDVNAPSPRRDRPGLLETLTLGATPTREMTEQFNIGEQGITPEPPQSPVITNLLKALTPPRKVVP